MKKIILTAALASIAFADVYATFEAKALKEASLSLSSSGIVDRVFVDIGSRVKKGDILLSLNDREERAALAAAKSDYAFLSAQYERYKKSSDVFDKNTLEKLRAELDRAKNSLAINEERVAKMRLTAPYAGIIAEKNIEIGDTLSPGSKAAFRLLTEETKLIISFDSKYEGGVKVGDEFCYAYDGKPSGKCAKITKIYPAVNQNNKKLSAEAKVSGIKVGIFGDGTIKTK